MTQYKSFELFLRSYQAGSHPREVDGVNMNDKAEFCIKTPLGDTELVNFVLFIRRHAYPHTLKYPFFDEHEALQQLFEGEVPYREIYDAMGKEIDTFMDRMRHPERYHRWTHELLPEDQWGKHKFAGEPRKMQ